MNESRIGPGLHEKFFNQIIRRYIAGLLAIFLVIFFILFYLTNNTYQSRKESIIESNRNLETKLQMMDSAVKTLVNNLYNEQPTLEDLSQIMELPTMDYFNYKTEAYMKQSGSTYLGTINFLKNAFKDNVGLKAVYFKGTDSSKDLLFIKEASIRFIKNPQIRNGDGLVINNLVQKVNSNQSGKLFLDKKELRFNHDLSLLAEVYFIFDITDSWKSAKNRVERNNGQLYLYSNYAAQEKSIPNTAPLDQRNVNGYIISSYNNHQNVFSEFSGAYSAYLFFVLLVILFTLPFIIRKLRQMEARVVTLFNKINRIKKGDLSGIEDSSGKLERDPDELSLISANIDEIAIRLSKHMDQMYQSKIKQKDYQIQSIRAQINPHFLYNTLEAIRMKALVNHDETVAEMLLNAATLYRNLIKGEDLVDLKSELAFCDAYLHLFEIRFEDSMFYDISCDKDLEKVMIEKFTLQPLIENYIHHGIDQQRNDNFIEVFCYRENTNLVAKVSDNGQSLSEEKVLEIQRELEENARQTDSMKMTGLFGVDYRLRSRYGDEYGLQLANTTDGFTVIVTIPLSTRNGAQLN